MEKTIMKHYRIVKDHTISQNFLLQYKNWLFGKWHDVINPNAPSYHPYPMRFKSAKAGVSWAEKHLDVPARRITIKDYSAAELRKQEAKRSEEFMRTRMKNY